MRKYTHKDVSPCGKKQDCMIEEFNAFTFNAYYSCGCIEYLNECGGKAVSCQDKVKSMEKTPEGIVCRSCGRGDKLVAGIGVIRVPDAVIDGTWFVCKSCEKYRNDLRHHILFDVPLQKVMTTRFGVFRLIPTFSPETVFSGHKWEGPLGGELFDSLKEAEARMHDFNCYDDQKTYAVFRQYFEITGVLEIQRT